MPLWGNGLAANEPSFLGNTATPPGGSARNFANTYGDNHGWILIHPSNPGTVKTECIVAIPNLAKNLGAANITMAYIQNTSTQEANLSGNVVVVYNQQVTLLAATPILNLTQTGSISSNVTPTYVSGNGNNQLVFSFTTPNNFAGNTTANTVLTIGQGAGSGSLNVVAGNIVSKLYPTVNAYIVIPTTANVQFPLGSTDKVSVTIAHNITQLSNIAFLNTSPVHNGVSNIFANFTGAVRLDGATLTILYANTLNPAQNLNATYFSGNNTSNIVFNFTPYGNAGFMAAQTANLVVGTIVGRLYDTANAFVGNTITQAIVTAAGNETLT